MNNTQTSNINISVSHILKLRLKEATELSHRSEEELIIEAVEKYLEQFSSQKNCYDLAKELGLIGAAVDLPINLSTNSNYLDEFGSL